MQTPDDDGLIRDARCCSRPPSTSCGSAGPRCTTSPTGTTPRWSPWVWRSARTASSRRRSRVRWASQAELAEGVLADGLWWELSLSYHYYTLAALVWTVRVARGRRAGSSRGTRPCGGCSTRPLAARLSRPHAPGRRRLLVLHRAHGLKSDMGYRTPPASTRPRARAMAIRNSPGCWSGITRRDRATDSRRCSTGPRRIDGRARSAPRELRACRIPASPFCVPGRIRSGESCLMLKAGPDGGVHGHPDQLAIQLFAAGARLVPDPGHAPVTESRSTTAGIVRARATLPC